MRSCPFQIKFVLLLILLFALGACSTQQQALHSTAIETLHKSASPDQVIGARAPGLELDAYPRQGFAPLQVTFHAVLQGVSESDSNYKCLYQEWNFGDGRVSGEQADCSKAQADPVDLEYITDHTFQTSGTYTIQFRLGDKIFSKRIQVSVYDQF